MNATAMLLDEQRLHLQHGPIDLIVMAEGNGNARERAFAAAARRFETVLAILVDELDLLRQPVSVTSSEPRGPVARRMMTACRPHAETFVTPMAAVAGAVADDVLAAMASAGPLTRAAVNNGGDIAIHLSCGNTFKAALAGRSGIIEVHADSATRGIATSGRGGRSLSLGIADAVTVLAKSAAMADVAATLIANAVDLPGNPAISRAAATTVRDDSDLGNRRVVTGCGPLSAAEKHTALEQGIVEATRMRTAGLIDAATLYLRGEERTL